MEQHPLINAVIANQSGLPDDQVRAAIDDQWSVIGERFVELSSFNSSSQGGYNSRQMKPQGLFVRSDYIMPTNPIEEIELALRLFEEDDDIANTIGMMSAVGFNGMKNIHSDEQTVDFFNAIAYEVNLDMRLRELYESLLSAASAYMLTVYHRTTIPNGKTGPDPTVVVPAITFLNPLSIRIVSGSDFGITPLAQEVDDTTNSMMMKLHNPRTSAAEKNQIRKENPLAAALYIAPYRPTVQQMQEDSTLAGVNNAWILNPNMVKRYTLMSNSSQSKYPQVLLRRAFGLAEAKRLLNLMDWSLLSGAINFLIVVRKGSDKHPAHPLEIQNLQGVVKAAARSGVMVGDHRLQVDIVMPNMEVLLDDSKRSLLGRKISKSIMRLPDIEFGRVEGGGTPEGEIVSNVIMSDRLLIKRMIERNLYSEIAARNPKIFTKGWPKMWFPPVTITGHKFFNEQVLKLRDRGDISRSTAVETAGFDPQAEMANREREKADGFDDVMTAENVPSTGANPLNTGRPSNTQQQDDGNKNTGTE